MLNAMSGRGANRKLLLAWSSPLFLAIPTWRLLALRRGPELIATRLQHAQPKSLIWAVQRWTENSRVGGANPSLGTIPFQSQRLADVRSGCGSGLLAVAGILSALPR